MTRLRFGVLIVILAAGIWSTRPWWEQPAEMDDARQLADRRLRDREVGPAKNPAALDVASTAADTPHTSSDSVAADRAVVPASAQEPLDSTLSETEANIDDQQKGADRAEAAAGVQTQSPLPDTPIAAAATPKSPLSIDLLSRIDLERDVVKGDWQFDSGQLSSPPDVNQARVQVPVEPPAEYTLRMVVMRGGHGKYTTLGIGLVAGGRQFYVLLDSNEIGGSLGLDLLDGKSWNQNSSTRRLRVLTDGVPAEVVCTVLKSGLSVQVDGREVLQWKGDYNRLSLYSAWAVPHKRQLFLGTDCNYVFSQLMLTPLGDAAKARAVGDVASP